MHRRQPGMRKQLHALGVTLAGVVVLVSIGLAHAEDLAVPAHLQVDLMAKVVEYDRGFPARAGSKVVVAIVSKPGDIDSTRAATQILAALSDIKSVGGLPHEEIDISWTSPAATADICRQQRVTIVYLTPGLSEEVGAIARALEGVNVLTVAGLVAYVPKGAVLGFDLVEGRPKLVVNLPQAGRQGVAFRGEMLKIARIVE